MLLINDIFYQQSDDDIRNARLKRLHILKIRTKLINCLLRYDT